MTVVDILADVLVITLTNCWSYRSTFFPGGSTFDTVDVYSVSITLRIPSDLPLYPSISVKCEVNLMMKQNIPMVPFMTGLLFVLDG